MQNKKVQFTLMVIFLWLYNVRKNDGLNCSTGNPPLWESPTKRCTFHFNWDCSLSAGEAFLLKTWIKEDNDTIARWTVTSKFTAKNGFDGRLEQYNENGLILKDLTAKDAGYYRLVVILRYSERQETTSSIYIPSIPSCDADQIRIYIGTDKNPLTGRNDTSYLFLCNGGEMPALIIGLLAALGIMIVVLFTANIYICGKYKLSQNDLNNTRNDRGEELNPLSSPPRRSV